MMNCGPISWKIQRQDNVSLATSFFFRFYDFFFPCLHTCDFGWFAHYLSLEDPTIVNGEEQYSLAALTNKICRRASLARASMKERLRTKSCRK